MKTKIFFVILTVAILGIAGNALANEGGTKLVAAMAQPEGKAVQPAPVLVVPYSELVPGKPVTAFLRRIPEPTLSAERIREEKFGPTTGTKAVVLFQEKG